MKSGGAPWPVKGALPKLSESGGAPWPVKGALPKLSEKAKLLVRPLESR